MLAITKLLLVALVFLVQAVDPSGHWAGSINIPEMSMQIEIDIGKNANGTLVATFAQPERGVKGVPFTSVSLEGRTVRLVLKSGPDTSTFQGTLSLDGEQLTGTASQAGMSAPFAVSRTGEAQIAAVPSSAAITEELEGTWNGRLDVNGAPQRLIVKMTNQADGTAAGTVMSPDGSGVEIPIAMTQNGTNVTIDVPSVGASFAGALNPTAAELSGTWSQQGLKLPITFKRQEK